jgi:hypothetical protein
MLKRVGSHLAQKRTIPRHRSRWRRRASSKSVPLRRDGTKKPRRRHRWNVADDLAALERKVERIDRAMQEQGLSDTDKQKLEDERFWTLEIALLVWRLGAADLVSWAMEKMQKADGVSRPVSESDELGHRDYLWWLLTRMNEQLPIAWRYTDWVPLILRGQDYADLLENFRGSGRFMPRSKRKQDPREKDTARLQLCQLVHYYQAQADNDPLAARKRHHKEGPLGFGRAKVASMLRGGSFETRRYWLRSTEKALLNNNNKRQLSMLQAEARTGLKRAEAAGRLSVFYTAPMQREYIQIDPDVLLLLNILSSADPPTARRWYAKAKTR